MALRAAEYPRRVARSSRYRTSEAEPIAIPTKIGLHGHVKIVALRTPSASLDEIRGHGYCPASELTLEAEALFRWEVSRSAIDAGHELVG